METANMTPKARDLAMAICLGGIDPAKCTVAECMDKFKLLKLRHFALHLEDGGYFLLCSDPEIIIRVREALAEMDNELEASLQKAVGA